METTNIIVGIGFATLAALIVTLIVQVRALRSALAYLGEAQIKSRDEVVFRGIHALREALGRIERDDEPRDGEEDEDGEDEAGDPALKK